MNQREIKFRAWDEKKKAIRDVTGINWYDEYLWVDETPMTGDKLPIESTPLMQSTGLKDKNGKDIYEGDIIKGEHLIGEWVSGVDMLPTGVWFGGARFSEIKDFEIIGNLYENPNLLNL